MKADTPLRLGSRRSPMAVAQSGDVARLLTERTGRPVEIVGVTTFGGFRYGDDHHAVIAILVRDADEGTTPDACLDTFERWAEPTARDFNVSVETLSTMRASGAVVAAENMPVASQGRGSKSAGRVKVSSRIVSVPWL